MNSVLNLMEFKDSRDAPVLVLADLHTGILSDEDMKSDRLVAALENCRSVLAHAREMDIPVAFLRQTAPAQSMLETCPCPTWIRGFEPRRSDMVFDRAMPSGYTNAEFTKMIESTSGSFVLAGLSGEMSCLSTVVDAYHHRHQVTYLADASYCSSKWYFAPAELEKGVAAVLSLYSAISDSKTWIDMSSRTFAAVA